MAIRLIISFKVQAGKAQAYAAATAQRRREGRQEPGCEQFDLLISHDDPDAIVQMERWRDQAALDVHAEARMKLAPAPSAAWRIGEPAVERYET